MGLDQLLVILFLTIICALILIIPNVYKKYIEYREKKVKLKPKTQNNHNEIILGPQQSNAVTKDDLFKEVRETLMVIHKKINNELYIPDATLDYNKALQEIVEVLESYSQFLGEEWLEKKKEILRGICSWEELKIKLMKVMWD